MKNPVVLYLLKNQVLAALIVIAAAWFIFQIKGIIVAIFVSYIIMAALYPLVSILMRRKLSKALSVFIVFVTFLLFFILLIIPLIPFFVTQISSFLVSFPNYLRELSPIIGLHIDPREAQSAVNSQLTNIGGNALEVGGRVFGGFFSLITALVVSFYLLLEHDNINKRAVALFPSQHHKKVLQIIEKIEDKLGSWLRGQLFLSVTIGVITWIALTIAGIPYALPLALMAGLLEIIPTVGPIIAAVPAIIVALSISPTMAIIVAAIYIVLQLLENHVLVPRIMSKAVGLNSLVVLLGIIIGTKLLGIPGALLSVPFISLVTVIYNAVRTTNDEEK